MKVAVKGMRFAESLTVAKWLQLKGIFDSNNSSFCLFIYGWRFYVGFFCIFALTVLYALPNRTASQVKANNHLSGWFFLYHKHHTFENSDILSIKTAIFYTFLALFTRLPDIKKTITPQTPYQFKIYFSLENIAIIEFLKIV